MRDAPPGLRAVLALEVKMVDGAVALDTGKRCSPLLML